MARLQGLCLVLIATLYGGCHAQKIIRTLMPMTLMESCPAGGCNYEDSASTCADDLNALLLLARALETDRATNANKGIDVNGLLDNLIRALVYIATHLGSRGSSSHGSFYPGHSSGNTGNNKDPLIDVHLLGSGKDNLLAVGAAGNQILGVGVGPNGNDAKSTGTSNQSGGLLGSMTSGSGGLSGATGAVSGITGTTSGTTGTVSAVSAAVSGITGTASGTTGAVSGMSGAVSGVTGTTSGTTGTVSGVTGAVSGITGTTSGGTGAVSGVSGAVAGLTGGSGGGSGLGGLSK